jgi:hypothetical protein
VPDDEDYEDYEDYVIEEETEYSDGDEANRSWGYTPRRPPVDIFKTYRVPKKPASEHPRRRKQEEFKVPDSGTYDRPERLGRILMRCLEYIETTGSMATMAGGEEDRTCLDIILKEVAYRKNHGKSIRVIVKPDMYSGNNDAIRELLTNPVFDESRKYALPKNQTLDNLLYHGYTYYDILNTYGYAMSFEEAILKFFVLNDKASPEQGYCKVSGIDGATGDSYSCISDVLDIIANDEGIYDSATGSTVYLETVPEIINKINNGMVCAHHKPRGNGKFKTMPCLQKLIAMATSSVENMGGVYSPDSSYPFITRMDEYDWSVKTDIGLPMIQEFLNRCSAKTVGDGGYGTRAARIGQYLLKTAPGDLRSGFFDILTRDYNFRNVSAFERSIRPSDGYSTINGIDYMVRTGILLSYLSESVMGREMIVDQPLCRYAGYEETQSCFARLIDNTRMRWATRGPDVEGSSISSTDFFQYLNNLSEQQPSYIDTMQHGLLNGDCSLLRGKSQTPITCMDVLIDSLSGEVTGAGRILDSIVKDVPLSDLTCTDERFSGLTTNCLDKLVGESANATPIIALRKRGVLLNLPDCTDSSGNAITCVDKMMQRHEVWVYAKFQARFLRKVVDGLTRKLQASRDSRERESLAAEIDNVSKMMANLSVASKEMNITGYSGFQSVSEDYDIGSMKSHSVSYSTPLFRQVLVDDLEVYSKYLPMLPDISFDREHNTYVRELIKSIDGEARREYLIAPRLLKLYDINQQYINTFADYIAIGIPDIISPDRMESVSLNTFECKNGEGKTISCVQKIVDMVPAMYIYRAESGESQKSDEFQRLFSLRDMYKPKMCDLGDNNKISCLEYAMTHYNTVVPRQLKNNMGMYVAMMSNKEFPKYADSVIKTADGKEETLRSLVCSRVDLFHLSHYLMTSKGSHHNVGDRRPRYDHLALALHSTCSGCDKVKDPLDKRVCVDSDCFKGFIADTELEHSLTNEKGESYGGYNILVDNWATAYAKDPEFSMSHFKYRGEDDLFGLSGVYDITFDPARLGVVNNVERFDYAKVVEEDIFPAIRRTIGTKFKKFKNLNNVVIKDVILNTDVDNDWAVTAYLHGYDGSNSEVDWSESIPVSEIFTKGRLLGAEDVRGKAVKYKHIENAIKKIATMKTVKKAGGKLTMVISNRPADFLRSSTCQQWTSCMGFRSYPGKSGLNRSLLTKMNMGGYVAYVASDELSPSWMGRMLMTPAMEKPGERDSAFIVDQLYGLPQYEGAINSALGVILREHGYNGVGSYNPDAHAGRSPGNYVFNDNKLYMRSDLTPAMKATRRGGLSPNDDGGFGGIRLSELSHEARQMAIKNCIERTSAGESILVIEDPRNPEDSYSMRNEGDCKSYLTSEDARPGGFYQEMSPHMAMGLFGSGLITKDLAYNIRFSDNWISYDGGTVNHKLDEIDGQTLHRMQDLMSVIKVKDLSTIRGRGDVLNAQ